MWPKRWEAVCRTQGEGDGPAEPAERSLAEERGNELKGDEDIRQERGGRSDCGQERKAERKQVK